MGSKQLEALSSMRRSCPFALFLSAETYPNYCKTLEPELESPRQAITLYAHSSVGRMNDIICCMQWEKGMRIRVKDDKDDTGTCNDEKGAVIKKGTEGVIIARSRLNSCLYLCSRSKQNISHFSFCLPIS